MSEVFIITMHRFGDASGHSYVLGVFTVEADARAAALQEVDARCEKYAPRITAMIMNQTKQYRTVLGLPKPMKRIKQWLEDMAEIRMAKEKPVLDDYQPCRYRDALYRPCGRFTTQYYCAKHAGLVCISCGDHATHACSEGWVCNVPLCDDCHHDQDGHVRRPSM